MTLPAIGCVTEGVCSARRDMQPSNTGNVPLNETNKTWQRPVPRPQNVAVVSGFKFERYHVLHSAAAPKLSSAILRTRESWSRTRPNIMLRLPSFVAQLVKVVL
jgi:hypothetical protein